MTFVRSSVLIATIYLALSARALPRPAPTYQVVDVGGPSSDAAVETVYSTITESQATVTVTASGKAVETQSIEPTKTSSAANTEMPAYSHSSGSPPLPTLDAPAAAPPTTTTATATETETVYNTVPVAPYAVQSTSTATSKRPSSSKASSPSKAPSSSKALSSSKASASPKASSPSKASSSLKAAFTAVSQWNHTVTAIHGPASTGTGTGVKSPAHATGSTHSKRWFAATGTGAFLAGRAAPTGTGAYLADRAASTGYLNVAEGWNATSYYYASNDRLA